MALRSPTFLHPRDSCSSSSLQRSRLSLQLVAARDQSDETDTATTTSSLDAIPFERPDLLQCPELLLTGLELETRTPLRLLHKKGRRFESSWEPFFVGIYAHALFYFADRSDWPHGVVPLVNADVKAVDRIFRQGDASNGGDDCGPCWKVTSSSGRVMLFRAPSHDARVEWIEQLRRAAGGKRRSLVATTHSMDGKAALALARRLVRSASSASTSSSSTGTLQGSPRLRTVSSCGRWQKKVIVEDKCDQTERLRDALRMVEKQRYEIQELHDRLKTFEMAGHGMKSKEEKSEGRDIKAEVSGKRQYDDDVRHRVEEVIKRDVRVAKDDVDEKELELNAMLNDAPIGLCKVARASAISDVLSDNKETSATEEDDDEDIDDRVPDNKQGNGRKDTQNWAMVDKSTGICLDPVDGLATEADPIKLEIGMTSPTCDDSPSFLRKLPTLKPPQQEAVSAPAKPVFAVSSTSSLSAALSHCHDAAENESIQQQAAELVEMARSLNKDDASDSFLTRKSSDDGSLPSSFKGSHSGACILASNAGAGNDFLQQQAMELAEIARNLQSSYRADPDSSKVASTSTSSSSLNLKSQDSFSGITDFGLDQINSNGSDDSIFSITQDDLFFDEDEDGEIERLSEFDASDSQFLEASGFLDSIHQVMKDFIVSTRPDPSRVSEQSVISEEIVPRDAYIGSLEGADSLEKSYRQRALRMETPADGLPSGTSPRIRSLFSHARSARDFFSGDTDRAPVSHIPKDISSLVVEDTMSVVASILQSAEREDKMRLLSPFLRIFGSHNRLSHLMRWAIEIEVASVINVATLFRSDDYASRFVSTYSKAIGSKFIRVALSDPIRQIFKLKIADMELNPHKEESLQDEAQAGSNAANLMRACQNIIDSIMKNTHCIPSSYFHICSHLNSVVISRFDGSKEGVEAEDASTLTRSVIGGFLFLRFVCPAITTPHLYGLTKLLPPPETRRVLVLVTKLLFKTATGVKFGDREPQFQALNPFIEKNSPAIQQLFANLAMSPSQDIDECFASDSRKIYSHVSSSQLVEDLEVIRSVSEKNIEEIEKKLEDCNCAPGVTENFKAAVLPSSDPLQKSSLTKKLSANMKFLSGFGKKPKTQKQSDQ
uniref:Ras-GAP domain-containing protein n=1 Tax=Hyaloperonospora arabidopsidis (strain Emoy2) TaxID=559515 RepID=M4BI65_HYAAE